MHKLSEDYFDQAAVSFEAHYKNCKLVRTTDESLTYINSFENVQADVIRMTKLIDVSDESVYTNDLDAKLYVVGILIFENLKCMHNLPNQISGN